MPKSGLFTLPYLAVLALALLSGPPSAAAQTPGWHPAPLLVAQKKHRVRPRVDNSKIACRPGGCFRIPLGCYPETEYNFWGEPTGYDKIVCPPRRR